MRVYVEGIGVAGPGLRGWGAARRVLRGIEPFVDTPVEASTQGLLPAAEARRTGLPVRLALAVANEALIQSGRDRTATATVFTSSSGDGDNVHQILDVLASPGREVSPTRFHNSVHNAAAGYWSIASQSRAPSTSLCGYDASFAVGLIDAATQALVDRIPVALVAYDHPYPPPLHAKRPIAGSFAVALVLAPDAGPRTCAVLDVAIRDEPPPACELEERGLEALRRGVPAARALPLLRALALGESETRAIEYVAGRSLRIGISPWG